MPAARAHGWERSVGKVTNIPWCRNSDGTPGASWNGWIGCEPIAPECINCYATGWAKRCGKETYGAGVPRRRTSADHWRLPLILAAQARRQGIRISIFGDSLSDIFDPAVPPEWRADVWALVAATPELNWIFATKRIDLAAGMLPGDWGDGYPHVTMLVSAGNQDAVNRMVPQVLCLPFARRGLSHEPGLGPIDLSAIPVMDNAALDAWRGVIFYDGGRKDYGPALDWVITGGENASADKARPYDFHWAFHLHWQRFNAPGCLFVKQGGRIAMDQGKLLALRDPKGADPAEWPRQVRIREVPFVTDDGER